MTYDINTISQSELLKLLLSVKDQFSIDAIDGEKAKYELEQQEKALLRRKQLESEIAKSGFSRNELLDIITVKSGKELLSDMGKPDKAQRQIFGQYLYEGEIGLLAGDDNDTLSILANDIAFFVSGGGHDWENMSSPHIPSLYFDMGMTGAQFAHRYENVGNHMPEIYTRAEIDLRSLNGDKVLSSIKSQIIKSQAVSNPPKFIIIDHVSSPLFKTSQIKTFICELNNTKERYGLTILLISNCLKKKKTKPIDIDDLGTSKALISYVDSALVITTSIQDEKIKYIKQLKTSYIETLKDVMTVSTMHEPYPSFDCKNIKKLLEKYAPMAEHENITDYPEPELWVLEMTPEIEIRLVEMWNRKRYHHFDDEKEIADELGISRQAVFYYTYRNGLR